MLNSTKLFNSLVVAALVIHTWNALVIIEALVK